MSPLKPEEIAEETEVTEKKTEKTAKQSTHFGDADFYEESPEDIRDATWGEVYQACCVHSGGEWGLIVVGFLGVCFFLYFFLLGLDLLGTSAKVLTGCTAGDLLGGDTNPIAGLMIGILATVLLQSSSTTTSIIVSLVDTIGTRNAIFMIMGANIGTSVTNTIVAMGHMGHGDELERAFAGATVHDLFNFLTVLILLPLEVVTQYLYRITKLMVPDDVKDGDKWEGPVKKFVAPIGKKIIIANKNLIKDIANGDAESCDDFYPVDCKDNIVDYEHCKGHYGLIGCDKKTNDCPAFFQDGGKEYDDKVSGGVCLFLGLLLIVTCLVGLVTILQKMLLGTSTRIIYKATNINGYIAMVVGVGITILVQSSSITTSTLTPLVGMGVLQLEQMFPLTLGANIGTTFTALMSALVSDSVDSLQVALAHLFFNITGIIIWYPVPFMRAIPLHGSRQLGKATRVWRGVPIVYIAVVFFIIPLIFFGLSTMFEQQTKGFTVLGSFCTVLIFCFLVYFLWWWRFNNGKERVISSLDARQRRAVAVDELPDDMDYVKSEIARLKEFTGIPDEDADDKKEVDE